VEEHLPDDLEGVICKLQLNVKRLFDLALREAKEKALQKQ